ncbi:hypothetical protein [Paraburkholderia sp. J8-2]|uniref:hypothetical protein n=1 Tax=Paraburkholderia sp. J8-2 TaxID=2805440 RepID=UPI002AB67700|nr:hypothetical protein [Paraburkholderia sp. J8-2]
MSAVLTQLHVVTAPTVPTMPAGLSPADQQQLSSIAANLRVHFAHLQESMGHIAFHTARLVKMLQDKPAEAERFFCQVTGKSTSTFRAYRRAAKVIEQHFASEDGTLPDFLTNIPLAAYKFINESTDTPVIEAIGERASQGPVTESEVKAIVASATQEMQARLDAANDQIAERVAETQHFQANAAESARQATDQEARANSMAAQLRSEEQINRDLQADRDALARDLDEAKDEIDRLVKQSTVVQFQDREVQVVPAEFKNLEEVQRALEEATARRDSVQTELSNLESKLVSAQEAAQTLQTLEAEVGRISGLFPAALLEKLHDSDDQVSARIYRIAAQLRLLADTLSMSATA